MINLFRKKKPNVIMIMIDGLRHDALSMVPYYNELKKEATFFSRLITYAPYTIGSLHALFSGMNGNQNGVNGYYRSYSFDKKNCFTLAQYMKEQGYYTECDLIYESIIPTQGFEKVRTHDEFKDDLTKKHSEILNQIKNKKPFFLFLDYSKIHTNLVSNVIKKYSDFDREYFNNKDNNFKNYLEWAKASADYLKSIIEKIKDAKLWDDSIILVFTDHGGSTGDKVGERAYGVYLYEYTLRCFLYIIGKDFPKNLQIDHIAQSIDILPTIMDIFSVKEKDGYKKIQGKSFLPFIKGKHDGRIAYSETGGLGGPTPSPEKHNLKCVRNDRWKLIYNESSKKKELYDLEADPEEKDNLAGKGLAEEKELWEELQKYN
ncbi:sulfatase-like hydrolase/transferase [Candidatus Woesearchaeota archaeon]|nr:sulfatase-like hydrolase/transferase [Candidatus Woesearchaeota archaeon]